MVRSPKALAKTLAGTGCLFGLILATAGPGRAASQGADGADAAPHPALIVVVSVDQFSANLFDQWRGRFTGGFKTLADQGVVFHNGFQTHAATETCPGHSTMMTGVHPARTGIAANEWYDRSLGKTVYCLADPGVVRADDPKAPPVGPANLRATTFGDWLKAASPQSRVDSVSGKDRAAINLAGKGGDHVFWFIDGYGFTTYVRPGEDAAARLAPLAALNAKTAADWKRRPPTWTYTDPRCRALAGRWDLEGGKTLVSQLPPIDWIQDSGRPDVMGSPLIDELTLKAADVLIARDRLGQRGVTDVLGVGLSATDYVGHRYGTQGPEMCENLTRLDQSLGRFLDGLKSIKGGVLVVLTADHGGSDFPERMNAEGYPAAARVAPGFVSRLNAAVRAELKLDYDPLKGDPQELDVVNADGHAPDEALRRRVVAAVLPLLRADPQVAAAFSQEEVLAAPKPAQGTPPDELSLVQRFAESAVPGRSGDILVALKPYLTASAGQPGRHVASHGSPWNYDRRVPILFWSPGGKGQERFLPVETVDIAPTLAQATGTPAPADLDGRALSLPPTP